MIRMSQTFQIRSVEKSKIYDYFSLTLKIDNNIVQNVDKSLKFVVFKYLILLSSQFNKVELYYEWIRNPMTNQRITAKMTALIYINEFSNSPKPPRWVNVAIKSLHKLLTGWWHWWIEKLATKLLHKWSSSQLFATRDRGFRDFSQRAGAVQIVSLVHR